MRIQIIGNITVLARPGFECFQLRLWLAHIAIKVIELSQCLCSGSRIRIGGIKTLVMFNENKNFVLMCLTEQVLMLGKVFDGRLGDEDMDSMLDGVKCH